MSVMRLLTLLLASCVGMSLHAQQPARTNDVLDPAPKLEYFFDSDPGYGKGKQLECLNQEANTYSMSVEGLAAGAHLLCLRACDDNNNWSQTISRPLYVCSVMGKRVNRIEYFFDTDPGYGLANALDAPGNGEKSYALPIVGVGSGAHLLCLRAQDEQGRWSTVLSRPLYVINASDGEVTAIEYFFDKADPGVGNATAVTIPETHATEFSFDLDTAPMLLIHGDADGWAAMNSVKVWEKLRSMGIPCELHTLALRPHCFQKKASPGTGSYTWLDRIGEYLDPLFPHE